MGVKKKKNTKTTFQHRRQPFKRREKGEQKQKTYTENNHDVKIRRKAGEWKLEGKRLVLQKVFESTREMLRDWVFVCVTYTF